MTYKNIVAKRKRFHWQPSRRFHGKSFAGGKTKINKKRNKNLGSINLSFVIVFFLALAGMIYLYSINSSAVKGHKIRKAETEIGELKKEHEKLMIKEAELKSLYHIEEASKELDMDELNDISYIEEISPVAFK